MLTIASDSAESHVVGSLRAAFPNAHLVYVSVDAVAQLIAENPPNALLINGASLTAGDVARIAMLKARNPWLSLLALLPHGRDLERQTFLLGHAQVDEMVIVRPEHDAEQLRTAFARAGLRTVAREIEHATHPFPPLLVGQNLEPALERIAALKHPSVFARKLGVPMAQLRQELRSAKLFSALTLLAWCRVLVAARHLGDSQEPVERIGLSLGYASGPAFRNTFHKLVGATPTDVRQHGGLRFAAERFRVIVREWRAKGARA